MAVVGVCVCFAYTRARAGCACSAPSCRVDGTCTGPSLDARAIRGWPFRGVSELVGVGDVNGASEDERWSFSYSGDMCECRA